MAGTAPTPMSAISDAFVTLQRNVALPPDVILAGDAVNVAITGFPEQPTCGVTPDAAPPATRMFTDLSAEFSLPPHIANNVSVVDSFSDRLIEPVAFTGPTPESSTMSAFETFQFNVTDPLGAMLVGAAVNDAITGVPLQVVGEGAFVAGVGVGPPAAQFEPTQTIAMSDMAEPLRPKACA